MYTAPDHIQQPCTPANLQQGHIDALTCYCFRYLKPLSRYAQMLIKERWIAEDLAGKTLETLWEHRHEMENEKQIRKFLQMQVQIHCSGWLHGQLLTEKKRGDGNG